MKKGNDSRHMLLLQKTIKIADLLESEVIREEDVYEAVLDFVFILEYVVKKRLNKKNELLNYVLGLDENKVYAIVNDKKHTIHTIEIQEALQRYFKVYSRSKLHKHERSITILISNRNQLQHGVRITNMQSKDELYGVLNDVFPTLLIEAKWVLGDLPPTKIKNKLSYSEEYIQGIYDDIVLSKIKNYNKNVINLNFTKPIFGEIITDSPNELYVNGLKSHGAGFSLHNEYCPRCSKFCLSQKDSAYSIYQAGSQSDMYVCSNCNLELTRLEYDAVKRLKEEGKISFGY